jgi:peptide/nickel transport system ATP-binding protein
MSGEIRNIRGHEIALVPQEPMASLSPVHTIGNQIMEAIILHQKVSQAEARAKTIEILSLVGFPQPKQRVDAYPHQLSGGLRQRAVIAMALSCHPSLLIAGEPTTASDDDRSPNPTDARSAQEPVCDLYITHNLGVVAQMTERVIVMYMGKVFEEADVDTIFHKPLHPYTSALLRSIPRLGLKTHERQRLDSIRGTVPDPYAIPKGCTFHPREETVGFDQQTANIKSSQGTKYAVCSMHRLTVNPFRSHWPVVRGCNPSCVMWVHIRRLFTRA